MWKITELVLNECIRIFKENRTSNVDSNMGEFPKSAIVVFNTAGTEDGTGYDNIDTIEEVWEIVDDKYTVKETCGSGIPCLRSPISGAFYPMGEFYFNVNMIEKEVYLCYILGPRYGRGFKYQLQTDEEKGKNRALTNPRLLWVM